MFAHAMNRALLLIGLLFAVAGLLVMEVVVGSAGIAPAAALKALIGNGTVPSEQAYVVRSIRLPQGLTALVAGAGLAVGGLVMQTVFRNPLAGPSVMGVSSGASLGVAVALLAWPLGGWLGLPLDLVLLLAAIGGALGVLALVMAADRRVGDASTLLIIGLLIGFLCASLITVLEAMAPSAQVHGFVLWGMGSFAGVPMERLAWLALPVAAAVLLVLLKARPLNALLLGEEYALTMGVHAHRVRKRLLWLTGLLAGAITAFCGPVAFIGLITPHLARAAAGTTDHAALLPTVLLMGAALALCCDLLSRSGLLGGAVPLNAVTSLLGVPVLAWILFKGRRWTTSA